MEKFQMTELPDGDAVVIMDGDTVQYSKAEVDEMVRDGQEATERKHEKAAL